MTKCQLDKPLESKSDLDKKSQDEYGHHKDHPELSNANPIICTYLPIDCLPVLSLTSTPMHL